MLNLIFILCLNFNFIGNKIIKPSIFATTMTNKKITIYRIKKDKQTAKKTVRPFRFKINHKNFISIIYFKKIFYLAKLKFINFFLLKVILKTFFRYRSE